MRKDLYTGKRKPAWPAFGGGDGVEPFSDSQGPGSSQSLAKRQKRPLDRPGDLAASEKALGEAVGVLVARIESYPELRSHENVLALQEELVTTENRVAFARHAYNDAVVRLNELRSTFPTNVVAGVLSYQAGELLDWPDRSIADAPALDFDRESAS